MDWYRFDIRTRCASIRQRWYLVDVVEGLGHLGLREVYLEAAQFAGAGAFLDIPLHAEIRGQRAHAIAEEIMARLSQELGAKSYLFVGDLQVKALALAKEEQVRQSQDFFSNRGFSISAMPVE